MCAIPDKATTAQFRTRSGLLRAYKVIYKRTAKPCMYTEGLAYHPGRNVDPRAVKTCIGYQRTNRGFHCYLRRKDALDYRRGDIERNALTVVCITFNPFDVIAVEASGRWRQPQIVVRALNISDRAWRQAGLPAKASRKEKAGA